VTVIGRFTDCCKDSSIGRFSIIAFMVASVKESVSMFLLKVITTPDKDNGKFESLFSGVIDTTAKSALSTEATPSILFRPPTSLSLISKDCGSTETSVYVSGPVTKENL